MKRMTTRTLALSLGLMSITTLPATAEVMSDGLLAVANDSAILKSEYANTLAQVRQSYAAAGQTIPDEAQLQQDVLDGLIAQHLQLDMIKRAGIQPSVNQVNERMLQIAKSQGVDSLEALQQKLDGQAVGQYQSLREGVIQELSLQALQQHYVSDRVSISDAEAEAFINSAEGKQALEQAKSQMSSSMIIQEWHTRHILVSVDGTQSEQAAETKINQIYDELRHGADFESLAKTYSDDPGSAKKGGELGWVKEGIMVPEFEEMMQKTPVGDYSTPFTTQYGWHILQVVDKQEKDVTEDVYRSLAKDIIYQNKAPQAYDDWINEMKSTAYIQIFQ